MQMKTKAALKAEVEAMSEPRRHLSELIERRDAVHARIADLQAALSRLGEAQAAPAAATELARLDAREAHEMSLWSRSGDGPAPKQDVSLRDTLNSEISASRARSEAARQAAIPLQAELTAEHESLRSFGVPIQVLIAEILRDEARPLFEGYRSAAVELQARRALIEQSALTIMAIGESLGRDGNSAPIGQPILAGLERFSEELRVLFSNPPSPSEHEAAAAWRSLSGRLNADPSAKLDA